MTQEKPPSPTPEQLKQFRKEAGITQKQAADLLYVSLRAYQYWEDGSREMIPALFELLRVKV
ncbi:MAG: hypothetical protein Tsb002_01080 [Wenzhouxiangellaceae bacterium]